MTLGYFVWLIIFMITTAFIFSYIGAQNERLTWCKHHTEREAYNNCMEYGAPK